MLAIALRREVSTVNWPEVGIEPEGPPRGTPVVDGTACNACGACIKACPSACLSPTDGEGPPLVDAGSCGICVQTCPEHAIALAGDRDVASLNRSSLVMDGSPPEEVEVGRAPSSLYRQATLGATKIMVQPGDILNARMGSLKGKGQGKKDQDR